MDAMRRRARKFLGKFAVPFALFLGAFALQASGGFSLVDGAVFDQLSRRLPASEPQVIIIEQGDAAPANLVAAARASGARSIGFLDPATGNVPSPEGIRVVTGRPAFRLPARDVWALRKDGEGSGTTPAAINAPTPRNGISRSMYAALPAPEGAVPAFPSALAGRPAAAVDYLVPLPERQIPPRIAARQLLDGDLEEPALNRAILLVATPDTDRQQLTVTTATGAQRLRWTDFIAMATQALAAGNQVRMAPASANGILLAALTIFLIAIYRRVDAKRLFLPVTIGAGAAGLLASGFVVRAGHLYFPPSAAIALTVALGIWAVLSGEAQQEKRLANILDGAVRASHAQAAFRDPAAMARYLGASAIMLGLPRSMVFKRNAAGSLELQSGHNAGIDEIAASPAETRAILRDGVTVPQRGAAMALLPGWGDQARLSALGEGDDRSYWAFALPETGQLRRVERAARAIALSFRELQSWQGDLATGGDRRSRFQPIDVRMASAANLITLNGEQLATGLDELETAVMVYHFVGYPVGANAMMRRLFEEAGLAVNEATAEGAIAGLTDLDYEAVGALLRDITLNGGEMRVPVRDFGTDQRILRVAASGRQARSADRVLVLEAIEVSKQRRLADLRLAVANFLDKQLRNDIEAIGLGASIASDERIERTALTKVIGRISDVTRRATDRLDSISELLSSSSEEVAGASYPVEARKIVNLAVETAMPLAEDLGVEVRTSTPDVSGFSIAEPERLTNMIAAMIRVVTADTVRGGAVDVELTENEDRSIIRVSGGFGMDFERLVATFDNPPEDRADEYRAIAEGIARARRWQAGISYWSALGKGYRFNIELRRIG